MWMLRAVVGMLRGYSMDRVVEGMSPVSQYARVVWMLRAMVWMLRAIVWMLRAIVWMLRARVWMLRAIVWMLRAMVWMLSKVGTCVGSRKKTVKIR